MLGSIVSIRAGLRTTRVGGRTEGMKETSPKPKIRLHVCCVLELRYSIFELFPLFVFNCAQKQQKPWLPSGCIKSWGRQRIKVEEKPDKLCLSGYLYKCLKSQIDYNSKLSQRASNTTILKGSKLIIKEKTRKQLDDPTVGDRGLSRGEKSTKGQQEGILGAGGTLLYPNCVVVAQLSQSVLKFIECRHIPKGDNKI